MNMGDLQLVYLFNIVIFHSYVSCDFELGISCVRSVFLNAANGCERDTRGSVQCMFACWVLKCVCSIVLGMMTPSEDAEGAGFFN